MTDRQTEKINPDVRLSNANRRREILNQQMPKYLKRILDLAMSTQADERENRLKQLSQTLHDINRRDMDGTLSQLSLEFYRPVRLAEDGVSGNEIGGAEGHRLIAESIHDTLKTLEVKQRKTDR